ncbi:hypothetical protein JHK85_007286 [Glycine max]|nr:hypothetical protein JHK85_007286 [Glycine max]KAG5071870.1 hypothetical protein JHK86_007081 [Glycine max]KHN19721.1 Leucine-rich repeat receptor-like protein kinase TDR [Glycine soja]
MLIIVWAHCFHNNYNSWFSDEVGSWKLTMFQHLNFAAEGVLECSSMSDKILEMGSMEMIYRVEMLGSKIFTIKNLWLK